MNQTTKPAKKALLFPDATPLARKPDAISAVDVQDLYSQGMDCAIGLQKASLAAAVRLQTEVMDSYKDSYKDATWTTPELTGWFDLMAQALASFMQWQMTMLAMLVPAAVPAATVDAAPVTPVQLTPDEMDHVMDVGTGQRKKPAAIRRKNSR